MGIARMKTVQMATIDVLVVDDFNAWRDFVKACLYQKTGMHITGAAEAIQKAKELQPNLVILYISLPGPDGIQAAWQIRTLTPRSRILFLSGSSDPAVARQAIMAGDGYLLKWDADLELVPGIEAVLSG
jgi:DNA-binding NarL/FixJ family response regulator